MTYKLVIFDCDGVLVDSEAIGNRFISEALTLAGIPISAEGALSKFLGGKLTHIKDDAEKQLGFQLPPNWVDEIYQKQFLEFRRSLKSISGIENVLNVLERINIPVCVGSNGPLNKMEVSLGVTNLKDRFSGRIFSADEVEQPKPAPDLYLYCADQMGVLPQHCLVIEDSPRGASAGVSAGMSVFGYAGGEDHSALEKVGCTKVFDTMQEIANFLDKE